MDIQIQKLIERANFLISNSNGGPGVRYPQELKEIIRTLVKDYHWSVAQIAEQIPVSTFSIRNWPKNKITSFKKISITELKVKNEQVKNIKELKFIKYLVAVLLVLQVLVILEVGFLR